jgi:hypothetical protein
LEFNEKVVRDIVEYIQTTSALVIDEKVCISAVGKDIYSKEKDEKFVKAFENNGF